MFRFVKFPEHEITTRILGNLLPKNKPTKIILAFVVFWTHPIGENPNLITKTISIKYRKIKNVDIPVHARERAKLLVLSKPKKMVQALTKLRDLKQAKLFRRFF